MRVFIASSWHDRDDIKEKADKLRTLGMDVSSSWHDGHENDRHFIGGATSSADKAWNDHLAHMDMNDLRRCEMFIYIPAKGRIGHHTELGMAIAWDKDIVLIGQRLGLYSYYCKIICYDTWEDFLEAASPEGKTANLEAVSPQAALRESNGAEIGLD